MQIVAGKSYRTRDGRRMCMRNEGLSGAFTGTDQYGAWWTYYKDGSHLHPDDGLSLIAEWVDEPASPVRTVTRKEIVPGTYGRVMVKEPAPAFSHKAHVRLCGVDDVEKWHAWLLDASELRAAAKVFTDLADALEQEP